MSTLIKASFWLSLSELVFNISGYIIHALMGRILDPAGYGRFSLIITFTTMIIILIGRGIPISTSKYLGGVSGDKANNFYDIKKSALFLQIIVIFLVTSAYFFLAPVFANILRDPTLTNLFRISSLIIPSFALASFYAYYFTGIQEFKKKSFLKILRSLLKIVLVVGLGYFFKVVGALIGQALAPLLVYLTGYLIDPFTKAKLKSKKSFKNNPTNFKLMKKLANFAGPIVIFMLFYEFMLSMNLYFIKALIGRDDLTGIYSAANTVSRIPYYLFFFMTIILLPKISELIAKKNYEKTERLLGKAFKYLFIILIPITTILSLFSDSAVRFFYGSQYTSAGEIMSILIFGFAFLTVFYILTFVLNGAGKNKFPMIASLVGVLINGVLNFILIKQMGLIGSAIATTVTAILITLWALIYSNKKIAPFLKLCPLIKYSLASLLIYFIGASFMSQGRFIFILWSFVLIAIYLAIMVIWKELGKKDLDYIFNSLKK